jgi:hypothetical protein
MSEPRIKYIVSSFVDILQGEVNANIDKYDLDGPLVGNRDRHDSCIWVQRMVLKKKEVERKGLPEYSAWYEELWSAYNRYGSKKEGWTVAYKKGLTDDAFLQKCVEWVRQYQKAVRAHKEANLFLPNLPHIQRFFKQELWEQDIPVIDEGVTTPEEKAAAAAKRKALTARFLEQK